MTNNSLILFLFLLLKFAIFNYVGLLAYHNSRPSCSLLIIVIDLHRIKTFPFLMQGAYFYLTNILFSQNIHTNISISA